MSHGGDAVTEQPRIQKSVFGQLPDGRDVEVYTLSNAQGLEARLMNYGATLLSLRVPDRQGNLGHAILYPETLDECLRGFPLGSVIGRFANRISGARFAIDGVEFKLEPNAGKHHIHGGSKKYGFQSQLWKAEPLQEAEMVGVKLTLVSPDRQAGYPGTLEATAIYRLTDRNELVMEYSAASDKPTHVNLTNHAYWNLAGPESGRMLDHILFVNADRFLPTDEAKIPTGEVRAVAGTPLDFTNPLSIGSRIEQVGRNYDHCYVLNKRAGQPLSLAARVIEPASGRTMEVYTTQPGVQLYTGNRRGFCLETQHFPNTPNERKFPSTLLRPGETFHQITMHKFEVQK